MLEGHRDPTRIIAAANRDGRPIAEAAVAGAPCVTAGVDVYQEGF
jgi:hypothetical protein